MFDYMGIFSSSFSKTEVDVTEQSDHVHINSQGFDNSEMDELTSLTICRCTIMDS